MILKTTNYIFTILLLVGGWQTAQAQAPMSTNDYYIMRQQTVGAAAANQAKGSGASAAADIEAIGNRKIKAGRASMSFTPTQVGLERFTKGVKYEPEDPQTFPGQLTYIKSFVKRFNDMLTAAGGKINNCADAYALAYATSYMAYYNESPNTTEVKKLRQQYIEENINSASFQGMSDADKQWYYNSWALMSIQAIDQRTKSNQATSKREKQAADDKAKLYAKYALGIK